MVLDMATPHLVMVMDMVLDIPDSDTESVLLMLSQRLMLSMELMVMVDMVDMAWDTAHTPLDMVLDTADIPPWVVGMDMAVGLDTMVKLFLIRDKKAL